MTKYAVAISLFKYQYPNLFKSSARQGLIMLAAIQEQLVLGANRKQFRSSLPVYQLTWWLFSTFIRVFSKVVMPHKKAALLVNFMLNFPSD